MRSLYSLLALGLALSCTPETPPDPPVGDPPVELDPCLSEDPFAATPPLDGPYCVGFRNLEFEDTARDELLSADLEDKRRLRERLYYPVRDPAGAERALYGDAFLFGLFGLPVAETETLRARSFIDAPAADEGPFPLVTFSPGLTFVAGAYQGDIEHLVSQGFVVAAVDHPYFQGEVRFDDGTVRTFAERGLDNATIPDALRAGLTVTAADLSFVVDALAADADLQALVDTTTVGMFGHSFGGASSVAACSLDSRCAASLNYDGTLLNELRVYTSVDAPMALFLGEGRYFVPQPGDPSLQDTLDLSTDTALVLELAGAAHTTFSDVPYLRRALVSNPNLVGTIDPELAVEVTRAFNLAWFDRYLRDGTDEDIDSGMAAFAEITLERLSP